MTQVFHNSMHKVTSGRVTAKVPCPYLGCARKYRQTDTQRIMGYKERRELKQMEEGEEGDFR